MIRMLTIRKKSICTPLGLIFDACILNGGSIRMEKGVTIHKNNDKEMFGKLLSCLVATTLWQNPRNFNINEIFLFFIKNGLTLKNQSGFKPANQFLFITHKIYK